MTGAASDASGGSCPVLGQFATIAAETKFLWPEAASFLSSVGAPRVDREGERRRACVLTYNALVALGGLALERTGATGWYTDLAGNTIPTLSPIVICSRETARIAAAWPYSDWHGALSDLRWRLAEKRGLRSLLSRDRRADIGLAIEVISLAAAAAEAVACDDFIAAARLTARATVQSFGVSGAGANRAAALAHVASEVRRMIGAAAKADQQMSDAAAADEARRRWGERGFAEPPSESDWRFRARYLVGQRADPSAGIPGRWHSPEVGVQYNRQFDQGDSPMPFAVLGVGVTWEEALAAAK